MDQCILSCEALGPTRVVSLSGREAMSELSRFELEVLSDDGTVDLGGLLTMEVALALSDGESVRAFRLVVTGAAWAGEATDGHRYQLSLAPKAHALGLRVGHEIFQGKTTQIIVQELFERAGVEPLAFRLSGQYAERVYSVRYGESEWDYAARLLADEGISLFFDVDAGGETTLVFADSDASYASIEGGPTLLFEEGSGMNRTPSLFFDLEKTTQMTHDRVHVREFDVRQPDVLIEGRAGDGALEYYEFPAQVPHEEAATARASARLEQLRREREVLTGKTHCVRLQPGRIVSIEGATSDAFSGTFLVVEVTHSLTQATRSRPTGAPYVAHAKLVPFGAGQVFRPPPPRRVRVHELETAVVTGAAGDEIHVDDLGSIKVRFRWDRSGKGDDTSSRWVRTLQPNLFSSLVLPRVGFEVPILYVDGSPDSPVALGRMYGGSAATPYSLPGKKATATLQSASSPGGGTTHEVRFGDDAGSMEFFVHATRDQTVTVGGTQTTKVGVNASRDVTKSYEVSIDGSQSGTITGNQTVVVGTNLEVRVKGSRVVLVGGMETIKVKDSRTVEVSGMVSDVVGAAHLLQCNQSNTVVQGGFVQSVVGAMTLTAGLGTNRNFAGLFAEEVGGVRTIVAAKAYSEEVKGSKTVTASPSKETAGGKGVTKVKGAASIQAVDAKVQAGKNYTLDAKEILIEAGGGITIKAGGKLTVKGSVKPKGSTLKFDANKTSKKSGSKVGS